MKLKNKFFFGFLLLLVILSSFSSYKVFRSHQQQRKLIMDYNTKQYEFSEKLDEMEVIYPKFSVTSMNLKGLKARYLIHQNKLDAALEILETVDYDPLSTVELYKAQIYYEKNEGAEFYNSAKKAFVGLPLNEGHLLYYLKALINFKEYDKVNEIYNDYEDLNKNSMWAYFYFLTIYSNKDFFKGKIEAQAKKALNKYGNMSNSESLKIILYYILYGESNFKKSIENFEIANELFRKEKYNEASLLYEQSRALFPLNVDYYYNDMVVQFKKKNHDKVLSIFTEINDSINPKKGRLEFLVGKSYLEVKDTINACKFFKISGGMNFLKSKQYLKNICIN